MNADRTSGERMSSTTITAGKLPAVCAFLIFGLAGCAHKPLKVHIPVATPVDLEKVAPMEDGDLEQVPEPDVAPLQWPEPPKPPVRRRPAAPTEAGGPAQPGNEQQPPELNIGTLTTGGDASQQSLQQARDLIGSVDKRIASVPARVTGQQRGELRQARNLLEQARQALNTGDAEGAMTVADKARQIMDEVERR